METPNQSLAQRFQQYFDVDLAGSQEKKNTVFGIRYRAYCEDLDYEPPQLFPDKREHDEFDDLSLHCLITHRTTGKPAGCVRLVAADNRRVSGLLPFEKHCPGSVPREFYKSQQLQRESMCEISRLAVDRAFRRRAGEQLTPVGEAHAIDYSQQEKRSFSLIAVAGFLAATALTELTGRTQVFAMMEPSMPSLMKSAGIEFHRAGQDMAYHGSRAAYFAKTEQAVANMRPELRQLYDAIYRRVGRTYRTYHERPVTKAYKVLN